jgi:hypothetical protein
MAFKLGVLLVHGMGNQEAGFADEMIDKIKIRLKRLGSDDREISFAPVWWAHVLGDKEATLLRNMADGNDLEWMILRSFVVNSLGDALAYQDTQVAEDEINVYQGIHAVVADKTAELRKRMRSGVDDKAPEAPLVIIAHSLGAQIMSNYIWDVQAKKKLKFKVGDNPFEQYETLTSIITFGCNIPLFTLALNTIEPIAFPPAGLAKYFPAGTGPEKISEVARWVNYYDPDDVLGYPLKTLDQKYNDIVSRDIPVNVGNILRSWNPASHTAYWTDDNVIKPIAESLHNILDLLPPTSPDAATGANRTPRSRRRT